MRSSSAETVLDVVVDVDNHRWGSADGDGRGGIKHTDRQTNKQTSTSGRHMATLSLHENCLLFILFIGLESATAKTGSTRLHFELHFALEQHRYCTPHLLRRHASFSGDFLCFIFSSINLNRAPFCSAHPILKGSQTLSPLTSQCYSLSLLFFPVVSPFLPPGRLLKIASQCGKCSSVREGCSDKSAQNCVAIGLTFSHH